MIKNSFCLLFAVAAAMPTNVFADDDGFKVHLSNGASQLFTFSETKKIIFNEEGFTVKGTDVNDLGSFFFDDVAKITFENATTDIKGVQSENGSELSISLSSDRCTIMVSGIETGRNNVMRMHTVTGTTVMSPKNFNGTQIDISNLPGGIYILSINNNTFKFKK